MAIAWGGYATIGGVRLRAGVEHTISPANPTPSTSSVTVTTRIYLQVASSSYGWGNGTWEAYSDASGSGSFSWNLSNGASVLVATVTKSVPLIYGATQTFNGGGRVRPFTSYTGTVQKGHAVTIPARPYTAPAAPTNFSVTRHSDGRHDLSWTRNATTGAPYTSLEIRRQVDGQNFQTIANPSGTATSYSDRSTASNSRYRWAIRARNSAGVSDFVYGPWRDTTPAAPGSRPTALKLSSGAIRVTRPALPPFATHWRLEHSTGGVWTQLAVIPAGTSNYTHSDPSTELVHTYRIRAATASPVLVSGPSPTSLPVQLLTPPAAPSHLGPSVADAAQTVTIVWRHNPLDTTEQTRYRLRSRPIGSGTSWQIDTGGIGSPDELRAMPWGPDDNGMTWETQVQTWGEHSDPGPWSPLLRTYLSARPVTTITYPGENATLDGSVLVPAVSYFHAQGSSCTGWQARLMLEGQIIESREGSGFRSFLPAFSTRLENGYTYTVQVRHRNGYSQWSSWAAATFDVDYALPPVPTLQAEWHRNDGYATLTPDVPTPASGEVSAASLEVYRATSTAYTGAGSEGAQEASGGWVLIADDVAPGQTVVDMIPPLGTTVVYRAVAVSSLPSTRSSVHVPLDTSSRYVFFNYGPGFGAVARVWGNLSASQDYGRQKALHHFAGRDYPVEFIGRARDRTYEVSAKLFAPFLSPDSTSTYEELLVMADAAAPVCVRDPEGVRLFCSVDPSLPLSGHLKHDRSTTISLTVVDHQEVLL